MASTKSPTPATAEQIARNGQIAATLREAMNKRGWGVSQLNAALGFQKGNTAAYLWLAAKGSPNPETGRKLAKLLDVPLENLQPRESETMPSAVPAVRETRAPRGRGPMGTPLLSFRVNDDGSSRITLDVELPAREGIELLNKLLAAGLALNGDAGVAER